MRAFEFLTEYNKRRIRYQDGQKPNWYDKAVQLKKDNPRMTAMDIGKQVDVSTSTILYWLAGKTDQKGRIINPNSPYTQKDFPRGTGMRDYYDGDKPEWYDQALQMAKAGETFRIIGKKFGVSPVAISDWLVKGRRDRGVSRLKNPDAELEPRQIRGRKLDKNLINDFIKDGYTDADIIELIADEENNIVANIRAMLPQLRQKLNPGTSVIDKTSTDDIDITFVKENFSD
mgnify:FL=1